MFYERGCQEQSSPDLAAESNLLAASPVVYGATETLSHLQCFIENHFACFNAFV